MVLLLSGCAAEESASQTIEVTVGITVCNGAECFIAPVPDAAVSLSAGGVGGATGATDRDGRVVLDTRPATVVVEATWAGLEASAEVAESPGVTSLTLVFPAQASTE